MVKDNLTKSKEVQAIISDAINSAKEKAEELQAILKSWGNEDATNEISELNRELVSQVQQSPILLDIAKYLGKFREMIRQKRRNAYAYGRGEKYSLETGNNLSMVISSEFAMLATPETIPLFLRKFQKKSLKQYSRREHICKGQGDIIVCLDESSSTRGDNAAWGKAVAYAMLEIAKLNGRDFALIHFASEGEFKTDLFRFGAYTTNDVLASAQSFLGGGTDFETPLLEAIRLMQENNYQKADIVFITDGICRISESFSESFKKQKLAMGFTVTGILMDQSDPGMDFSLAEFCNEVTRISEIGNDRGAELLIGKRA